MRDTRIYGTCRNDDNRRACRALGLYSGTRPYWQSHCETTAYSAGTVLTLNIGGYSRSRGCATLNIVCEAVSGPGVGANAAQAVEADEGTKFTEDDDTNTSAVVVGVAVAAMVVIAAGLMVAKRRYSRLNRSGDAVGPTIVPNSAFESAEIVPSASTHYYPDTPGTLAI